MNSTETQILQILDTIIGNGTFAASGMEELVLPGMNIGEIGEVSFPIKPRTAKEIIKIAEKAPFGKGSETLTDPNVRSAWQVDAKAITFHNKNWQPFLKKMVRKAKKALGMKKIEVDFSLYKLLIYEKGDFFLPHKDSEKAPGMFGTLVVGLPSTHTGGELHIRFDGREEVADFSSVGNYELPYVAFYADCEHEIKPVTSGYRVCLVYNLILKPGTPVISGAQFEAQTQQLAELITDWKDTSFPKAILLGHEYTPANFSRHSLKNHDRPRAEALRIALQKANYFSSLALVTHYQFGELEGDFGYDQWRYGDIEVDGYMGSIWEERTYISIWEENSPGLGEIEISDNDILAQAKIGEGEPTEQEAEGYTGNAGMEMQYWYHYGAMVFWPIGQHGKLMDESRQWVKLEWLEYYVDNWESKQFDAEGLGRKLISPVFLEEEYEPFRYGETVNYSPFTEFLVKLSDKSFLIQKGLPMLIKFFDKISYNAWVKLLKAYDIIHFSPVWHKVGVSGNIRKAGHLIGMLKQMAPQEASQAIGSFVLDQIGLLPEYLLKSQLHHPKEEGYIPNDEKTLHEIIYETIEKVLHLSEWMEDDDDWADQTREALTKKLNRDYVNEILVPNLLAFAHKEEKLYQEIHDACVAYLKSRTKTKPDKLPNWKREIPQNIVYYKEVWKMLAPFLASPTQQVFNYVANAPARNLVESAIKSATIDLKMETIKKGRPYTLRLTKTHAAYHRSLKMWEEDKELLEKLA